MARDPMVPSRVVARIIVAKTLPKAILCALKQIQALSLSLRAFIRIQKPLIVPPVAYRPIQLPSLS
jgi:hypothetical protein